METHFKSRDNSGEPRPTRVDRRHLSSISAQNMSLRDRFELDRPHSSHGDNHRKAMNHVSRKVNAAENDELVKHMSNLPSYLKRCVKPQEKAFSVGVLDWGLLEKWQSSKQVPYRSDGSSSSNSIASSVFSNEESSTCSQTCHSSAASHHRHHQFTTEASISDGKSRNVRKNHMGSAAESILKEGLNSSSTISSSKNAYPKGNDPFRARDAKSDDKETAAVSQLGSTGVRNRPLKGRSSEDNHCVMKTELPTVAGVLQGSRISKAVEPATTRDLSLNIGFSLRIGSRKSSSTEDAELPYTIRKARTSSIEKPNSDNSAAGAGKARSSPLKRLLEPLLKPREAINYRSSASLRKDSKPVNHVAKMPDRPSTAPGIQVGLNLNSYKSTNFHRNGEHNETTVIQALLQVVYQNGSPLFTFAVDSVKDIFCAALSKLGSDKASGDRYLYTFFSIQEIKNRSWVNLTGKGSGHEYSPNVVAQMEVSESRISNSISLRQFVLSAVYLKRGEKSEYLLNDELAALVVCIPRVTDEKMQPDKYNGTTLILPSGTHTLPSKGKPASLIERWRSGGQCDCGGWDPGCKLRILTDSKCQQTSHVKFKLFDEGGADGEQQQQPVFSMTPFKDNEGVLSISFSSSISPLQAFSTCLAVLDSRKLLKPPTAAGSQEAISSDKEGSGVVNHEE